MAEFSLQDILSEPTQARPEQDTPQTDFEMNDPGLEFEPTPAPLVPVPEPEPEEPYDADLEADKLIGLINGANILTMTPLARWKLKSKRGGKEQIQRMQEVKAAQFAGKKITEEEERLILQYDAYLKDKEDMDKAIPYTNDEIKMLKKMAVPYCTGAHIKVNGGLAFWTTLGTIQASRIIQIIQA